MDEKFRDVLDGPRALGPKVARDIPVDAGRNDDLHFGLGDDVLHEGDIAPVAGSQIDERRDTSRLNILDLLNSLRRLFVTVPNVEVLP